MSFPTDTAAYEALPIVPCPGCDVHVRLVNDGDGNLIMAFAKPDPKGELEIIAWDASVVYAAPVDERTAPEDMGLRLRRHDHPKVRITQLPMGIPAVAKWYEDVAAHTESRDHDSDNEEGCRGCRRLRNRMNSLRIIFADRLVEL